ncbi:MAG: DNA polymerase I [Candidatus Brocadiia bacterium]
MKFYLIDGSSYIYRAFYAIRSLSNSKGMPTNAIYGFVTMLLKIVRDVKPDYLAIAFDAKGPTFREDMYKEYKANRPDMPDELKPQIPYIKKLTEAFNIPMLEKQGYEADDVIGTLVKFANEHKLETIIVTGDKDLMQLVSDKVMLWDTMKDKKTGVAEVKERFGVGPAGVPDVFGLMGDTSDNIPGVPGIGEKTAVDLIKEFGSLEEILKSPDKVKKEKLRDNLTRFADQARLSKELATIKIDVPIKVGIEELKFKPYDLDKLRELFTELEFSKFLKDLTPVKSLSYDDYHLINNDKDFARLIDRVKKSREFAVDVETTSLDTLLAELVGISISLKEHEAYYIPLRHETKENQLPVKEVIAALKPILEDNKHLKIGQNIKYDMLVFRQEGVNIAEPISDTMVASYLLNPNKHNHNLEEISREHLGHQMITYKDVVGTGQKEITFDKVEVEKAKVYSAEDADVTFLSHQKLMPLLKEEKLDKLYSEMELPLIYVLADLERNGVKIDTVFLKELSEEFEKRLDKIKLKAYELAGEEFNLDSPKQLQVILYEKLGLSKGKKIKTGFSTDSDALAKLANEHDLPEKLLQYRTLAKLKNTYIDALPELVNAKTKRLHTSFNQTVTATGRLSSSDPNLQNIPVRTEEGRKIRQAFIPEKGCVLVSADYSQIELRLLAHFSKDKVLIDAFEHNQDIHSRTACEIFNQTEDMVSEDMRRLAKTINFGIIYGMSAHGLAMQLGMSHSLAQSYIDHYFQKYPKVKDYFEAALAQARKDGYVTTLMGRKRPLLEINSANATVRGFAERAAINAPLQGTAADIMKLAMIKVYNRLREGKFNAQMTIQVHDELVFEVASDELMDFVKVVRQDMENVIELDVPLKVDISKGPNWADMTLIKE